jgi:hypothetical protein
MPLVASRPGQRVVQATLRNLFQMNGLSSHSALICYSISMLGLDPAPDTNESMHRQAYASAGSTPSPHNVLRHPLYFSHGKPRQKLSPRRRYLRSPGAPGTVVVTSRRGLRRRVIGNQTTASSTALMAASGICRPRSRRRAGRVGGAIHRIVSRVSRGLPIVIVAAPGTGVNDLPRDCDRPCRGADASQVLATRAERSRG